MGLIRGGDGKGGHKMLECMNNILDYDACPPDHLYLFIHLKAIGSFDPEIVGPRVPRTKPSLTVGPN